MQSPWKSEHHSIWLPAKMVKAAILVKKLNKPVEVAKMREDQSLRSGSKP